MLASAVYTKNFQDNTDERSQGEGHDLHKPIDTVHEGQFGWSLGGLFEIRLGVACVPVFIIALGKWVGVETTRGCNEQKHCEDMGVSLLFVL